MQHDGKTFHALCEEYGVTKAHVARKLSVDNRTVNRWLHQKSWPTDRVVKVAGVLRIDPSRFLQAPSAVSSSIAV